jgi:para-nitrobenzyl esterase
VLAALNLRRNQVDELQTLPVAKLQETLLKVTGGTPLCVGSVLDRRSVPRHPFTPDAPAASIDVPAIVGSNKDETTVLFPPQDAFDLDWAGLKTHLTTALPCADVDKVIAELSASSASYCERSVFHSDDRTGDGSERAHVGQPQGRPGRCAGVSLSHGMGNAD